MFDLKKTKKLKDWPYLIKPEKDISVKDPSFLLDQQYLMWEINIGHFWWKIITLKKNHIHMYHGFS